MRYRESDANRRVLFVSVMVWIVTMANSLVHGQEQKQIPSEDSVDHVPALHEFNFTAEAFPGRPDGRPKELWGYNRQFPGPEIRVREGDRIRVHVKNELPAPTSIHWHGMKQRNSWQMDGVTPVSHVPIEPGGSFTYEFVAEPAGTHWYHSHTGVQYSEGL